MINPAKLLKLKGAWGTFSNSHPKFIQYLSAVGKGAVTEGTVIDITVTTPDGKAMSSNIKLNKSDVELFRELSDLSKNM